MATITPTNLQNACDSYAKALIDITALFAGTPTVATIVAGLSTGSPSAISRIIALSDAGQELTLLGPANTSANTVSAHLAAQTIASAYYPDLYPICAALETVTGGLNAFLAANGLQVSGYFSALFNAFATNATVAGYRGLRSPVTPIAPANAFILVQQTLATYTRAGSIFAAGTAIDGTQYAPAPLSILPVSGGGGTGTTFNVTYLPSVGANPVVITPTATVPGSFPGPLQALGVNGLAVTNITLNVAGTDTTAVYNFVASPLRAITTY